MVYMKTCYVSSTLTLAVELHDLGLQNGGLPVCEPKLGEHDHKVNHPLPINNKYP